MDQLIRVYNGSTVLELSKKSARFEVLFREHELRFFPNLNDLPYEKRLREGHTASDYVTFQVTPAPIEGPWIAQRPVNNIKEITYVFDLITSPLE